MKKLLVIGLVLVFGLIVTNSHAAQLQGQGQAQGQGQIGINKQGQGQDQGQQQGQVGINKQGQDQYQRAYGGDAYQGQLQGQAALQGNQQKTVIEGDEATVTTAVWPTTQSTAGKEEKSIYSLFGGIGSNKTEEHLKIEHQLKILDVMLEKNVISEMDYKEELVKLYDQLKAANRAPKLFGIIPFAGRGCNAINCCGLLSW